MGSQSTFHAPMGSSDFLGWRISRAGQHEIVYENGAAHRRVWRISSDVTDEADLAEALQVAVRAERVLPSLLEELTKRAIAVESIII